ncbi:MAG: glycerophosphodiester phosphodiesterase [Panacagrimonas sp.]
MFKPVCLLYLGLLGACTQAAERPLAGGSATADILVIAHRGASGHRPEHTLAAYELAIDMGADFIEPDLVMTRDGHLVARHENEMSSTTDVAERAEFAARRSTKVIDGQSLSGWFTEDFTLAELKTLHARERIPQLRAGNTRYNDQDRIPTFDEILALVQHKSLQTGRPIGVYPETKHPSYFKRINLPLEPPLIQALRQYSLDRRDAPVFIQSFEVANLRELATMTRVRLVQLFGEPQQRPYDHELGGDPRTYADLATPDGLAQIARYAFGIGPPKTSLIPRDLAGRSGPASRLVNDAHAAGLVVHAYTFRNENRFLPSELRSDQSDTATARHGRALDEYAQFYALGVDGVFSDHPDTAIRAREQFLSPP